MLERFEIYMPASCAVIYLLYDGYSVREKKITYFKDLIPGSARHLESVYC